MQKGREIVMKILIKDLCKNYDNHKLFINLNLSIEEGKITCIYGASGCGKTTIINIIGFIEPYQSGNIFYDGKEIKRNSEKRKMLREKIGFIFQDFGLIENETVKNNFLMIQKVKKMKNFKEKIEEALQRFQLENMINRKVYELSGGEQQRVAVAKILLKNPDLILADEPTASLDLENKNIVLKMLKDFSNTGKTVIIVSHDPEILKFSDIKIDLAKIKSGEV